MDTAKGGCQNILLACLDLLQRAKVQFAEFGQTLLGHTLFRSYATNRGTQFFIFALFLWRQRHTRQQARFQTGGTPQWGVKPLATMFGFSPLSAAPCLSGRRRRKPAHASFQLTRLDMDEDLKRTLDEQLANGLITVHDYSRKLEVLREANRLVKADRSRWLPGLHPVANEGPKSTTYPPLPIEHKGGGLGMYARRIRAWFRETPFRWSILTFFVPWFLRIPFAKLSKWRRGDLRYYYADGQNITGPLSFEDIESHVLAGTIGIRTLILREDSHQWLPLKLTEFSFRLVDDSRDRLTSRLNDGLDPHNPAGKGVAANTTIGCLSPLFAAVLVSLFFPLTGTPWGGQLADVRHSLPAWCFVISLLAAWRIPKVWQAMKLANRGGNARHKDWSLLAVITIALTAIGTAGIALLLLLADYTPYEK